MIQSLSPLRLIVEGWRFFPHSYSIVNQFQSLELLKRPDVLLRMRDAPAFQRHWRTSTGLLDPASEQLIRQIPAPAPGETADAVLRMDVPYRLDPVPAVRTCIFMTAESGILPMSLAAGRRDILQDPAADLLYLTPSEWSKRAILRTAGAPLRVAVVPHGIDPAIFRPVDAKERMILRQRWGCKGFVFAHLGSMTGNKNVTMLLKAFAAVAAKHPRTQLMLKGLDALYASQKMAGQAMGLLTPAEQQLVGRRILYVGGTLPAAGVASLYQACDAYVAPYEVEGFCMPVMEAAACGVPVICTAGGPTDEFTSDEFALRIESSELRRMEEGVDCTFRKPSIESLTAHMMAVIERPEIGERARVAGPAFMANGYQWSQVVERLVTVLRTELPPMETLRSE